MTLEPDAAGTRMDFVLNVSLRQPDGAVWQTTRSVSPRDFQTLPEDSLLAGRTGHSVLVNAGDRVRPPRKGGLATISVSVTPSDDGPVISTQSQQRFP